jgi:hypothetical protein
LIFPLPFISLQAFVILRALSLLHLLRGSLHSDLELRVHQAESIILLVLFLPLHHLLVIRPLSLKVIIILLDLIINLILNFTLNYGIISVL